MVLVVGLVGVLEARVVLPVAVVVEWTVKVLGQLVKIRVYDSWGCPGATREIRGVLESPSCCSRTISPTKNISTLLLLKYASLLFQFVIYQCFSIYSNQKITKDSKLIFNKCLLYFFICIYVHMLYLLSVYFVENVCPYCILFTYIHIFFNNN